MGPYPDDLGKRVQAARAYGGYSQSRFARKLGVGRNAVIKLERGELDRRPERNEMVLRAAARAAGLPYAFFLMDFEECAERLQLA
jgi:transcriptional regulator with XRE-family HTH domain